MRTSGLCLPKEARSGIVAVNRDQVVVDFTSSSLRRGWAWRGRRYRDIDARSELNVLDLGRAGDVVPRVAEAGGGQPHFLLVVQRHPLAHQPVDLLGHP